MKLKLFSLLLVIFVACDDPSLDNRGDDNDAIVTPIPDLYQIASIQIAEGVVSNIVRNIRLTYNDLDLIERVIDSTTVTANYELSYNDNNSLNQVIKTQAGVITRFSIDYTNDQINVTITSPGTITLTKQLFTDQQNRINRIVTREVNNAGVSVNREDARYNFDANFNVPTINYINMSTNLTERSSSFTYQLNNNAFRDMNDIVRLLIFEDFVSYTRSMPVTQEDFLNATPQRRFTFNNILQEDNFPSSRIVTKIEAGLTSTTFQLFNYRP